MKRKRYLRIITAAIMTVMLGLVSGCGNGGAASDATAEGVTVKEEKTEGGTDGAVEDKPVSRFLCADSISRPGRKSSRF